MFRNSRISYESARTLRRLSTRLYRMVERRSEARSTLRRRRENRGMSRQRENRSCPPPCACARGLPSQRRHQQVAGGTPAPPGRGDARAGCPCHGDQTNRNARAPCACVCARDRSSQRRHEQRAGGTPAPPGREMHGQDARVTEIRRAATRVRLAPACVLGIGRAIDATSRGQAGRLPHREGRCTGRMPVSRRSDEPQRACTLRLRVCSGPAEPTTPRAEGRRDACPTGKGDARAGCPCHGDQTSRNARAPCACVCARDRSSHRRHEQRAGGTPAPPGRGDARAGCPCHGDVTSAVCHRHRVRPARRDRPGRSVRGWSSCRRRGRGRRGRAAWHRVRA